MNNTTKWITGIIIVILIVWFGFLRNTEPTSGELIKIGAIAPLTGPRAEGGEFVKNGIDIAIDEINKDRSRKYKLEVIFEDSQYKPEMGISAIQKLKNFDHIRYIIGPVGSSVVLAVAPIAEDNHILMITPASQSKEVSQSGDYIFRTMHNSAQEAPMFAKFVASKMTSDTLHFLAVNTSLFPAYIEDFKPALEAEGKNIGLMEIFDPSDSDMRTQLLKIKNENPTDIFTLGTPKNAGTIIKQANELGLDVQYYNVAVEGPELFEIAGNLADGLLYPYSYDSSSTEKRVEKFQKEYNDRYGKDNDTVAANSYDSVYLLSDCIEKVGDNVDLVKDCLYQTNDFHGAGGTFDIDENGDAIKQFVIKTVKNGQFVKYEE